MTGDSFEDLGSVRCRFAEIDVEALVVNRTRIECISPACTSSACLPNSRTEHVYVPLEVSMQGVSYTVMDEGKAHLARALEDM